MNEKLTNYTRMSNHIIDKLQCYRLTGEEWQIFMVILRKTYGFQKKADTISLSKFCEYTGMKRASVIRSIKRLIQRNIIKKTNDGSSKNATNNVNSYLINKNINEWEVVAKKLPVVAHMLPKVVANLRHTKEIYKRNTILPNGNMAHAKKQRDPQVDFILDQYKKQFGFYPTDKKPRQVAHNFRQIINSFLKDLHTDRPDLTFEGVVLNTLKWYDEKYEVKGDTLDVVKRKSSILFGSTREKYQKGGNYGKQS